MTEDNKQMKKPDPRYFDEHGNYLDGPHYGKDCPVGKVQIEFVNTGGGRQFSPYGWTPSDGATLDIYIDGRRYHVTVGTFHDGKAERRGLHVVTDSGVKAEVVALNAASIWHDSKEPR